MKKQLMTLATVGVLLAGCSASATAAESRPVQATVNKQTDFMQSVFAQARKDSITRVISKLKQRVGRTWYVFSGNTPNGWDCSGLTMWAYEQLGVVLPHSANKQARAGVAVKQPMVGDLVLFGYPGTNTFFHASIYIGNNKVIHAGFRKGQTTSVLDLDSASVKNTRMKFVRVSLNG